MTRKKLLLFIPVLALLLVSSCVKETYEMEKLSTRIEYKPGFMMPLVQGEIPLENLINFDSIEMIKEDGVGGLIISENFDTLFSLDVSEIIEIKDEDIGTGVNSSYKIEDFTMEDVNFKKDITLSQLANNLRPQDKAALELADNSNVFPDIPPQDGGSYPAAEDSTFEYMTFSKGDIIIKVKNKFATPITNITININDQANGGTYSYDFVFNNVPVDTEVQQSVSIIGETMYNPIDFHITNIEIDSNTNTPRPLSMDNDSVIFTAQMVNLELSGGSAEINLPEPIDSIANQVLAPEGEEDIELTSLKLKSGRIVYKIINRMSRDIYIDLIFPHTTKSGSSVDKSFKVDKYSPDDYEDSILLGSSVTDLTMGGTTYNTFALQYKIRIDTLGKFTSFTMSDSVTYDFQFKNVAFDVIEGYFGKDTTTENDVFDFGDMGDTGGGILNDINGGFKFTDLKININYFSSLGIPLSFNLNMEADIDGNTETAGGLKTIPIPSAPGDSVKGAIVFGAAENLDNILRFPLPDSISYDVEALVNPGAKKHDNFITSDGKMFLGMSMEIPIKLSSEGFTYKKTIPFSLDSLVPPELKSDFLGLVFQLTNDLPLNVRVKFIPWDSVNNILYDPVIDTLLLQASEVDADGVTTVPSEYETSLEITSEGFDNVMSADRMIIEATIDTKDKQGQAQAIKLLTTYGVKFKVLMKSAFNYTGSPKFNTGGEGDEEDE